MEVSIRKAIRRDGLVGGLVQVQRVAETVVPVEVIGAVNPYPSSLQALMANNGIMTPTLVGVKRSSNKKQIIYICIQNQLASYAQINIFDIFMCLFIHCIWSMYFRVMLFKITRIFEEFFYVDQINPLVQANANCEFQKKIRRRN